MLAGESQLICRYHIPPAECPASEFTVWHTVNSINRKKISTLQAM
jgi:hypothetical protein